MKIKTALASVILVGSGLLLTPGVATASLGQCDNNHMCMWGNNDYKWLISERQAGNSSVYNLHGDKDNEMDSWANKSDRYNGCMYGGHNGSGDRQGMAPISSDNNVSPLNSDEVSSWRARYGC